MGKSDKKVKSERINALKKQYDSFLEDDKKRKERNEYILEKLDKMRYCTALLQVRQKPFSFTASRKVSISNMPEQALSSSTGFINGDHLITQIDTSRNRIDENILLQEISKKYILIPKLKQTYDYDTKKITPKIEENADWKSKYDILDQLKRDEKEQDSSSRQEAFEPDRDIAKIYSKENDITQDNGPLLEYKNDLPVKLTSEDQIPYDLQVHFKNNAGIEETHLYGNQLNDAITDNNQRNIENKVYNDNTQKNTYDENSIQNDAYDQNNIKNTDFDYKDIDNTVFRQNSLGSTVYDEIPSKDDTDYLRSQEEYNNVKYGQNVEVIREPVLPVETDINTVETTDNTYLQTTSQNIIPQEELTVTSHSMIHASNEEENNNTADINNQIYVDPDETALTHDMDASDVINESNNEMHLENDPTALPVKNDYSIETVPVQGFIPEGVQLLDDVNVKPGPQILVGNNNLTFDPAVEVENVNTPGETFNNDHHEENLYNEQTENYDYTEENAAENYNSEYSAPTENYQQNDEYAYYEGAQPEHPYTEINENEETTQQYDQNYEQQYGTAYDPQAYQQEGYNQEYAQGYEQHGYVDPQQQYETLDETHQDLPYESQDNLTAQYVEQQLDHEESYAENFVNKTERSIAQNDPQEIPLVAEQQQKVQ